MLLNFKGNPPPELIRLHANYAEAWCVSESEGKMSHHRECEINYFSVCCCVSVMTVFLGLASVQPDILVRGGS